MSFILDALKKSESDRQRQSGPSLFEVKVAPPRRALPVWAVAIAVLLGINIIVISWMLLRHAPAQPPAAVHTAAGATAPVAAARPAATAASGETAPAVSVTGTPVSAAPRAAARVAAPAPGAGQPPAAAPPPNGTRGSAAEAQAPPGASAGDYSPAAEPPPGPGSGAPATSGDALPLYQQVIASDGLPPLHLDLHVYAKDPRDRFVMINMHKLAEGGTLPNGVHVDAIRPDGVVLSYHGTQFLLPRD
jgi:general secretion pathway protein B